MAQRIYAFEPIVDEQARLLILGSMPSKLSIEAQAYYANPKNQFWAILSQVVHESLPSSYDDRIALLHRHHIALWDVIGHCVRPGSLDSAIRDEVVNDFDAFFLRYPNIHAIAFNGSKAYATYFKSVQSGFFGRTALKLPSTSPALTKPFGWKLERWKALQDYL